MLTSRFNDGRIETVETSPDGIKLLINLETRTGPLRPILVDIETLAITELIDSDDGAADVDSIVWGPDGDYTYAVISSSEIVNGTALDSSQGKICICWIIGTTVCIRGEWRYVSNAKVIGRPSQWCTGDSYG